MQPRQTLVALLVSMAIFYVAYFAFLKIWPPAPAATQPARTGMAATQPSGTPATSTAPATGPAGVAEAPMVAAATGPAGQVQFSEGASRDHIFLGSAEEGSPYPMLLEIDPLGADVINAWIRGHYETVKKEKPYHILQPFTGAGAGSGDSFATEIRFDDRKLSIPLVDRVWTLDPASTASRKVWTLTLGLPDGSPLARVIKTYELPERTDARTYDLKLSLRVENLSTGTARLILTQRGSIGFQQEDPRTEDRLLVTGLQQGDEITTVKYTRAEVVKVPEFSLGKDDENGRVAWVAESNKYFTCVVAPVDPAPGVPRSAHAEVEALTLTKTDLPAHTPSDLTFGFVTVPVSVEPGKTVDFAFDCYIGPKSKVAFQNVPAYQARNYYGIIVEGFYPCAPASLTAVMMRLLNFFHWVGFKNYGIAIIILVLVVRAILHPITKRSQVNMYKMQKNMARLQPKLEAVKQKYANDRAALNQAMMQVYKEEGVNPAGGLLSCLPMLLQIPIWGALWQALSSTIEMRHAPFDGWWIRDLAGPDALIPFGREINIPLITHYITGPIHGFNLLPILLGISQLLQMKYMPKPTTATPTGPAADQMEQQRKMMMYMSVFFMLMLYNAPSGLNLYIMASNFFGILEQWRIRQHLKELDEKKGEEPPPPVPAKPGAPRKPGGPEETRAPNWLQRKWRQLEKQVEDAKRVQGQRKREER